MKPFMQSLRESGILILSILVLLVSFGVYYYVYVENNLTYLTQRDLRQLNAVTKKTESTIGALAVAITNQSKGQGGGQGTGFLQQTPNAISTVRDTGMFLKAADNALWLLHVIDDPSRGRPPQNNGREIDVRSLTNTESLNAVFDIVLVMDATGEVLYQPQNSLHDLTIINLDTLVTEGGGTVLPAKSGRATGVSSIDIAGTGYKIFSQPLRLPATVNVEKGPWAMVGLTTVDHFRKESMKVSYDVLIVFVFLIFFVGLCWPLLKLVFIGPNEELRPAEVTFLGVTALLGSSLITILIVNFFCFRTSLVDEMDRDLASFALRIETNLNREIGDAVDQLGALNTSFRKTPIQPLRRIPDILSHPDSGYFPRTYPYLEMMYVVDDTGGQVEKWSVRGVTTPLIGVRERPYFQSVVNGRLWNIPGGGDSGRGYSLEPHLSWTTGAFESALAIPKDLGGGKTGALAMNTGPWSLFQTTAMRGFGYCVVDGGGGVLFHSDTSRNLSENIFDECDNDRDLISIVRARRAGYVKANYSGATHTMYVLPIRNIPWFVVTFRNEDIVKSADAEIISVSMVMFIAYAAVLFVLFALFFFRHEWHVDWAWPVESGKILYLRMLIVYLGVSIVFLVLRGFNASADNLLIMTLALPLIAVILTYCEFNPTLPVLRWCDHNRRFIGRIAVGVLGALLVLLLLDHGSLLPWFICFGVLAGGIAFLRSVRSAAAVADAWLPVLAFLVFGYIVSMVLPMGLFPGSNLAGFAAALAGASLLGCGLWYVVRRYRGIQVPGYRTGYAAAGLAFLFLAAVQPALNFYRITFDEQMKLFVKYEQLRLAGDLEKRSDHLRARYATIKTDSSQIVKRFRDSLDVYAGFFFDTNPAAVAPTAGQECAQGAVEELIIPFLMPSYDTLAGQMRALRGCSSADGMWQWSFTGDSRLLSLTKKSLILQQGKDHAVTVSTRVPGYVRQLDSMHVFGWVALLMTLGLMLWVLYALVTFFMKKVFLVDVDPPVCSTDETPAESPLRANVLILGPLAPGFREKLAADTRLYVVDMMKPGTPADWREKLPESQAVPVVVDHLECMQEDRPQAGEKLDFLEELVYSRQRGVMLISAADPLSFVPRPDPGDASPAAGAAQMTREADRWEALLTSFIRTRNFPVRSNNTFAQTIDRIFPPPAGDPLNSFFKAECGTDPYLQDIVLEMFENRGGGKEDSADFDCTRDRFVRASRRYYSALWSACTRSERRVLISLSLNGYASPSSSKAVEQLMRNRLIARRPALRLMNETFRTFVLDVQRPQERFALEPESRASLWKRLRAPLMVSVVAALLFLYATQREALNSTAAFITAAAGLLPALLRLLGVFQGDGASGSKDS